MVSLAIRLLIAGAVFLEPYTAILCLPFLLIHSSSFRPIPATLLEPFPISPELLLCDSLLLAHRQLASPFYQCEVASLCFCFSSISFD
jgi:hypothetical protein